MDVVKFMWKMRKILYERDGLTKHKNKRTRVLLNLRRGWNRRGWKQTPWLKTRGWTVVSETAVVENAVVETQKKHTHQMVRLVISSLLICSAG
jgi:hypothetical protein